MSSKKRFAASSLVLGLILCILEFFSSTNIWTFGVLLIGASLLIDSERNGNLLKRMLRVRPLPQVGLLSYSIYIWHSECIRIAKILSSDDRVIMGATFFALLVLFSLVSFNFIEKPIQRFIVNRFSSPISKSKWSPTRNSAKMLCPNQKKDEYWAIDLNLWFRREHN